MKQSLSDAMEDYARFRRSGGYAKGTLRMEGAVLRRFLDVNGNVWVHQITDNHVVRHFEKASITRQASSLSNDHNALQGFFKWARQTKRMAVDNDPMYGRRVPKPMQRERQRIHVSQFEHLLEAADRRDPRDRMMVALGLFTMGRDGELRGLRIRDVNLDSGYLHMVIAKSKLEDSMPISTELDQELRRWLTHYTETVGVLEPHYYLLPARKTAPVYGDNGRIISQRPIGYSPEQACSPMANHLKPILAALGLETGQEGGHTLRRSGARALFDALSAGGYDHALRIVQAMLHHSSMTVTEGYIGLSADKRTRDQIIRGKFMYGTSGENVVSMTG